MKLLTLTLTNYKGIRSFTLDPQGLDVDIYGDNGAGKTTIWDAFTWLLFDKDSQNKKDFDIKTLNPDGTPIHNLDHSVEAVLGLDGRQLTLKKVYAEKWTKKRGSVTAEFSGHTTDYYIDGVPAQKKEYDARIAEICDEEIFKLLTSPTYFNTQLHWQKRREILLQVCGDISDVDVIASSSALAELPDILGNRSMDDHRKVIAGRRTEINKELDRIPVRIDEATRALPDIAGLNSVQLEQQLAGINGAIQEKQQQLSRIEAGGEIAEKQKALRELEAQALDAQNKARGEMERRIQAKKAELNRKLDEVDRLKRELMNIRSQSSSNEKEIGRLRDKAEALRQKWYQINDLVFEFAQDDNCPTCGQALPEEQLAEAREKALTDFNRRKAQELAVITADGKKAGYDIELIAGDNEQLEKKRKAAEGSLQVAEAEARIAQEEIQELREQPITFAVPDTRKLQEEIEALKAGRQDEKERVLADIEAAEHEKNDILFKLGQVKQHTEGQQRIKELEAQQKQLAAEYERLEKELYLCDQFVRAKVALLDERINSRFKFARFKMFEQNINGGIEPCCETMYNGVPYGSGLNKGHQGIVGLDIIATLAEHYNFFPPIFYDNAESVTRLPEMQSQMICLYVSEPDKNLRVEVKK